MIHVPQTGSSGAKMAISSYPLEYRSATTLTAAPKREDFGPKFIIKQNQSWLDGALFSAKHYADA
jgi:hypothetical protein